MSAKRERIYVKVSSDFDSTGYMQPRSITWADGRTFKIDTVRDIRSANAAGVNIEGNCYTVVIAGKEKLLFFERSRISSTCFGRWFVQTAPAV